MIKIPTAMETIIAIIFFVLLFVDPAVKRYYKTKGQNLPTGKYTAENKSQRVITLVCTLIMNATYAILAPFFLIFDVYHLLLDWSTFTFLITSSNVLLIFQILGIGVFLLGNMIYLVGRSVIKERFAELWKPAKLGEGFAHTGIYSKVRHPLYLGGILMNIGLIILFQTWLGIILSIPSTIFMVKAAFDEEKWMIEQFGEEYKKYMKQTWRFFPKLW